MGSETLPSTCYGVGNSSFCLYILSDESKYSFTLRVTGITRKKAIGEYLDYQIPVSQLNPKGNGDMQAAMYGYVGGRQI